MERYWLPRGLLACALMVCLYIVATAKIALPQTYPNCTEFGFQISGFCCCTNDCCREAEAGEFTHIGNELYRSNVTGQIIRRTGWSPDGRTVKCSCDLQGGKWVKHPKANVRCLFVPMPSS
jgi:hypothetical protein